MPDAADQVGGFPRIYARTQRFSLGVPRNFAITADAEHVTFLRSKGPTDPVNCLWLMDTTSGVEQLLADPTELLAELAAGAKFGDRDSAAERSRRERARESAEGIVSYSTDRSGRVIAFALAGALVVVDASNPDRVAVRQIDVQQEAQQTTSEPGAPTKTPSAAAFDPRLSPDASHVSFVVGNSLWVAPADGSNPARPLLVPAADSGAADLAPASVSWGLAEFIAAEEMRRSRGHWWSPHSDALAVARVDTAPVQQWHIADPANPDRPPQPVRYPAAGTPNAQVQLYVQAVKPASENPASENPAPRLVEWDTAAFPYLCDVIWADGFDLTLVVQSRDQREMRTLTADPASGQTQTIQTQAIAVQKDPDWVDIVPGAPAHSPLGLLTVGEHDGNRAIALDGKPITTPSEWVREIVDVSWVADVLPCREIEVLYLASETPGDIVLRCLTVGTDGSEQTPRSIGPLQDVVTSAVAKSGCVVVAEASLNRATAFAIRREGAADASAAVAEASAAGHKITSHGGDPFEALGFDDAEHPFRPEMYAAGPLEVPTAVLWPNPSLPETPGQTAGQATQQTPAPLPVLLDPYGGPGAQRVLNARSAYAQSQWFANQGYCVVIADGRGTPGRGGSWQRAVKGDLASAALQDQISALEFVTAKFADRVNPAAVAIRGWSFGGYLAALAVLREPERFHAAIAGAPVADWALYDTHYTERYLGDPNQEPANYRRSSLLGDQPEIQRPIMLIHGLADDNVVAAHTLRLSSALLAAGHPHEVLPLTGVTHMTPQEVVAENLLLAQLAFLRRRLAGQLNSEA